MSKYIQDLCSSVIEIELGSRPGKASAYFGLLLTVSVVTTGWLVNIELWHAFKLENQLSLFEIWSIIGFFLLDLVVAYGYVDG